MLRFVQLVFIVNTLILNIVMIKEVNTEYKGQRFPSKYLDEESVKPTVSDLDHYLKHLKLSIRYFARFPNESDSNIGLALFFTKSLLKRTLLDNRNKLTSKHLRDVSKAIYDTEYILSHYIYKNAMYGWNDLEFKVSKLFQYDASLVYNIGAFNKNRLKAWIFEKENVNKYLEELDSATLPKEKYGEISECGREGYYINIFDSDDCIARVAYNSESIHVSKMHPCKPDAYCNRLLTSNPSVGYTLSHRLLNMLFRMNVRGCYTESEARDLALMDQLCSAMYREAVYVARRGFFARDLFLEHVALCGIMGYKEFHRRNWFNKASSWMNSMGCMKEFLNFDLNRTSHLIEEAWDNAERRRDLLKWRCNTKHTACDSHPSALLMLVLGHAVRYTVFFMAPS